MIGTWVQAIAMSWLIYRLTGSIIMLTTVAFINQIPTLILTPFAGVLCDRFNKFKIIVTTQVVYTTQAVLLAVLTLTGLIEPWHLMVLSLINGLAQAFESPARQSFYTMLVPKSAMTNAIALNSVTINGSRIIGPTIGGLLIALVGEGYCFALNAVSFGAVFAALFMMRLKPDKPHEVTTHIIAQLKEGIVYINNFLPLKAVLLFVATLSFFGLPFMSIIPALVKDTLNGDSILLGYINSGVGLGALTAAIYLAGRKHVVGLGKIPTITGAIMGLTLIAMSFTRNPVVATILAYPLGFSLIGSMATCNTLLQTMVENDKRGRVMSFFSMAFGGMAPLGGLVYGFFSDTFTLSVVLCAAGTVCFATAMIYERYRPSVRAAAHDRIAKKSVVKEIATAIDENYNNPF